MSLLDLPLEVFEYVIEELTLPSSITDALNARLVCKIFDREIGKAICKRQAREWLAHDPHLYPMRPANDEWTMNILQRAMAGRTQHSIPLLQTLQRVVDRLMQLSGNNDDGSRRRYLAEACACLVAWLCPAPYTDHKIFDLTTPDDLFTTKQVLIPDSCLAVAAWMGDLELVEAFHTQASNLHHSTHYFCPPVWAAAYRDHIEVMQYFIDEYAILDSFIADNEAAYVGACLGGHEEMVRFLMDEELELIHNRRLTIIFFDEIAARNNVEVITVLLDTYKFRRNALRTALCRACFHGAGDVAQLLLDRGGGARLATGAVHCPLFSAVEGGHRHILQLLLARGVDVEYEGADKRTAIVAAAELGRTHLISMLVAAGADVNNDSWSCLTLAVINGHLDTVEFLLQHGFDIDGQTDFSSNDGARGCEAVQEASKRGYVQILRVLEKYGCDLRTPYYYTSKRLEPIPRSPLWVAKRYRRHDTVRVLKKLLKK